MLLPQDLCTWRFRFLKRSSLRYLYGSLLTPSVLFHGQLIRPPSRPASLIAATAKSLQSCPTLCDPIDGSLPGSPVPGILQARTLEWVAISFSNAWKWKVKVKSLSHVQPSVTPWTAAFQAPLSMGFSRQEHWSGCHIFSPPVLYFTEFPSSIVTFVHVLYLLSGSFYYNIRSTRKETCWFFQSLIFQQWGTISRQTEWRLSKSLQAINAGEGVEKRESSYTVGGDAN